MTKPQFESYRYVGEICRLKSQSIVECRFAGSEIGSVLAVQANAVPSEGVCKDGEVQYGGKVLICVVYEDVDKKICRVERGVEFFHKTEGKEVNPSCFVKTALSSDNVSWRREGSGLYLSVVVQADLTVFGGRQTEYLIGGEGLIVKRDKMRVCKNICVSGETEGEDEFDTDYVGDVLLHEETALVSKVTAAAGQLDLEGEIAVHICVLKDAEVCSYERLIPFRMQIPCEDAFGNVSASASVQVKSAYLTANMDEEAGKSKMVLSYTLAADCYLSMEEDISIVSDAFSLKQELSLKRVKAGGRYLTKHLRLTDRIGGIATLSPETEGEYALQAAVLPRVELAFRKTENGWEAEGVAQAEVLMKGVDGVKKSTLSLPFIFPLDVEGDEIEGEGIVCSLNVRRKKNGETEAEGTLKCVVRCYERREWEYVGEVRIGEAYPEETCGFSVVLTGAGEDLWQVSKRLCCEPETLQKNNPDLVFPLKERTKICVYRQIK